jgi:translation initiation factor 3 subunit E
LIHWSLFVFVNTETGLDDMIDMFLTKPEYANTIQTVCPHILRYLTAAVIVTEKKRSALKDLVRLIQQESYRCVQYPS